MRAPVMPKRMPQGDRSSVWIELIGNRDAEFVADRQHLCGERFIELDNIDIANRHSSRIENPTNSLDRSNTHLFRERDRDSRLNSPLSGPTV